MLVLVTNLLAYKQAIDERDSAQLCTLLEEGDRLKKEAERR